MAASLFQTVAYAFENVHGHIFRRRFEDSEVCWARARDSEAELFDYRPLVGRDYHWKRHGLGVDQPISFLYTNVTIVLQQIL